MEKNTAEYLCWLADTRDQPLEEMAAFFDARTGDYEAHMAPWAAQYEWMARELPADTRRLLDLGCGTGLELDCIFRRLPHVQVTGVDLAGGMLKALARKHPGRALTLVRADYTAWQPEADGLFDAVVAFETLHHLSGAQKAALFGQIHRWLRPGGVFLECDYVASTPEMEAAAFAEAARRRVRDRVPPDAFVHFDTPLTLEHELEALRAGGFAAVEVLGFLPPDDHTPLLRAVKAPLSPP